MLVTRRGDVIEPQGTHGRRGLIGSTDFSPLRTLHHCDRNETLVLLNSPPLSDPVSPTPLPT